MTPTLLRRRLAPLAVTGVLIAAGIPALLAPAQAGARPHPRPPHAATPPDRVAYVQRPTDATSYVPQRTSTI
jgi:hypothetical protein